MKDIEIPLANITLRGLEFGDSSQPTILALHGWLDNAASFIPLAACLSGYHILAVDFAGHGKSDHRVPGAHYHLMDNVQDLHELVTYLKLNKVLLLGHSMGGIVASVYASCFPENVERLAVIESFGPLTMAADTSPEQLKKSIESRLAMQQKAPRHPDSLETAVKARLMAGDMNKASAQLLMERNLMQTPDGLRWRTDPRLRTISSLRLTEAQANAFIVNVSCPWLTLLGSEGFEKLKVNVDKRKAQVAQLELETCPGGHHLHMDNPRPVAEKISTFFS
ncbi:alpha/beta fold hydrolase [Planctobacterium marinum]|uniref:alpha/beta fold hydrolase n=1 Tax=Planctobacterium marinum TaxID=1631968 RepID=UPI001E593E92|nr:alpha/beta hydrolase [Planctobacterium marinum]MCC2607379.1 alpha/beta hydrolase [Planctobacterium marinum]